MLDPEIVYVVSSTTLVSIKKYPMWFQLVSIKKCGIEKSVALQQWWGNIIYRPPPLFCLFLQHNWVSPKYCPLIVFLTLLVNVFLQKFWLPFSLKYCPLFAKVLFQFLLRVWLSYFQCLEYYVCFWLLPLFFHFILLEDHIYL